MAEIVGSGMRPILFVALVATGCAPTLASESHWLPQYGHVYLEALANSVRGMNDTQLTDGLKAICQTPVPATGVHSADDLVACAYLRASAAQWRFAVLNHTERPLSRIDNDYVDRTAEGSWWKRSQECIRTCGSASQTAPEEVRWVAGAFRGVCEGDEPVALKAMHDSLLRPIEAELVKLEQSPPASTGDVLGSLSSVQHNLREVSGHSARLDAARARLAQLEARYERALAANGRLMSDPTYQALTARWWAIGERILALQVRTQFGDPRPRSPEAAEIIAGLRAERAEVEAAQRALEAEAGVR